MNKYLAMVIIKPDIREKKINRVQSSILNLFEQNTKVKKVWYLGKNKLDFKNKNYSEGIFIKLEIFAKYKKIEMVRQSLRENQDVISSFIMNNEVGRQKRLLPKVNLKKFNFTKKTQISNIAEKIQNKKVYMLVSKNMMAPFSENVIALSDDKNKIFESAKSKIYEYIIVKGYRTLTPFKVIKDVEKEFKRLERIKLTLDNNLSLGKELVIQERNLI